MCNSSIFGGVSVAGMKWKVYLYLLVGSGVGAVESSGPVTRVRLINDIVRQNHTTNNDIASGTL
jgi:hypothetical protein